jgi:hypothetical protein
MRTNRHILVLIFISIGLQSFGQTNSQDTIYFHKDSVLGSIQSIFIENNNNSKYYTNISHFTFNRFQQRRYDNSIEYLEENNIELSKKVIRGIPSNWIVLKQHMGDFYAYHPCDFLFHYKVSVNDSTYINWTGEGPVANKINEYRKIDQNTFAFILTGVYNNNSELIIHIIDQERGIAIFEKVLKDRPNVFSLMIDAKNIRKVPIIVNNCEYEKQSEFQFEDPEYEQLLRKK